MPSISLASYFRADHFTLHPSIPLASYFCVVHSLGELFSCRLFNSLSFSEFFCADHIPLHPSIVLESYFCAVHPSIVLESYFCAAHPLDELFSCRPFNCPISLSLGELFLCHSSLEESYSRADHLILHPLASYFRADHITLLPSILLASYFCAVHPLGELFS